MKEKFLQRRIQKIQKAKLAQEKAKEKEKVKQQTQKEMKKSSQNKKKDLISKEKSVYSKPALGKTWRQREKLWQKLTQKMEKERMKYLIWELDRLFSIYIRNRDAKKPCVTFWVKWCHNKIQHNCHFIGRSYYSHRRDEDNCHWWCWYCNTYAQEEHKIQYTLYMIRKYWESYVNDMLESRNKSKPDVDWMKERILHYKELIK